MTYLYYKSSYTTNTKPNEKTINQWKHLSEKKNWRITQLPNGFFQTEYKDIDCPCNPNEDHCCEKWHDVTRRETIEGAEAAIDGSVEHYAKKVDFLKGPKVVKTFK